MLTILPYVLLQCLAALLAWALIASRERSGPVLLEAGAAWLLPLLVAAIGGVPADTLVRIASCGIAFNLLVWICRGALRTSE